MRSVMQIALVTPAPPRSRHGNRTTAERWAHMLKELGHRVEIQLSWNGAAVDLMLALHARRSFESIQRFSAGFPARPLIVALTGTDLYRDIRTDADAQQSLRLATRMIVLQEMGLRELPPEQRAKTHVVYQSAEPLRRVPPLKSSYELCVIGHLREEKDPFRGALALRHLPADSRIRLVHMGGARSEAMLEEANRLMREELRYRWLGDLPHWRVRRYLARCRLMLISSRMEGGANVVCEALMAGTPIIASRISGNVGMLGEDYAGYFPVEDERALAQLLYRVETDPELYRKLNSQCRKRRQRVLPSAELSALRRLLRDVA
jgi:putative glycosyltransferase (TIGR04348 family)